MPNLLALVQKVHKLAQIQGSILALSDTGISSELAAIVSQSWVDVQELRDDFEFMRKVCTFLTTPSQTTYAVTPTLFPSNDDLGRWRVEPYCFTVTDPDTSYTTELHFLEYDLLRYKMTNATASASDIPNYWTFTPAANNLIIWPAPTKQYTANADYYRSAQVLAVNTDTPHIRSSWHDIIVFKALSTFGMNKGLSGLHQKYEMEYARRQQELFREFVPSRTVIARPAA